MSSEPADVIAGQIVIEKEGNHWPCHIGELLPLFKSNLQDIDLLADVLSLEPEWSLAKRSLILELVQNGYAEIVGIPELVRYVHCLDKDIVVHHTNLIFGIIECNGYANSTTKRSLFANRDRISEIHNRIFPSQRKEILFSYYLLRDLFSPYPVTNGVSSWMNFYQSTYLNDGNIEKCNNVYELWGFLIKYGKTHLASLLMCKWMEPYSIDVDRGNPNYKNALYHSMVADFAALYIKNSGAQLIDLIVPFVKAILGPSKEDVLRNIEDISYQRSALLGLVYNGDLMTAQKFLHGLCDIYELELDKAERQLVFKQMDSSLSEEKEKTKYMLSHIQKCEDALTRKESRISSLILNNKKLSQNTKRLSQNTKRLSQNIKRLSKINRELILENRELKKDLKKEIERRMLRKIRRISLGLIGLAKSLITTARPGNHGAQ